MEVIIVTVALLAVIAGVTIFLVRTEKRQRYHQKHQLLAQLRQLGHERQLRFSSEAYLKTAAIGLDGIRRTLLYFEPGLNGTPAKIICIALDEVQHCSTKHVSRTVYAAGSNTKVQDTFLETICLRFTFRNNTPAEELVFFKSSRDSLYEMKDLGKTCSRWESSLNKLIIAKEPPIISFSAI
jgi:hypothetical protein